MTKKTNGRTPVITMTLLLIKCLRPGKHSKRLKWLPWDTRRQDVVCRNIKLKTYGADNASKSKSFKFNHLRTISNSTAT